jgi:hypothetical protein
VLVSLNGDTSDSWEREGNNPGGLPAVLTDRVRGGLDVAVLDDDVASDQRERAEHKESRQISLYTFPTTRKGALSPSIKSAEAENVADYRMVVAPSSIPSALSRFGAAAAGVALSVVVVLLAQPNLTRSAWRDGLIFWVPVALLLITVAGLCWWFALRGDRTESRSAMAATWKGGVWVGAPSFALGFIGPLVIRPTSSLGPLLGILFTGPLGFVCGAMVTLGVRKLRPRAEGSLQRTVRPKPAE